MPSVISTPYIPPPGAMQFEITHPDTKYKGEVFWVVPAGNAEIVDWNWNCSCQSQYQVLVESCSPFAALAFKGRKRDGFAVCTCVGRIIE